MFSAEKAHVTRGGISSAVSECGDKSHVHFELLKDEKYVDPQSYVLFIKELEG